VSLQVKPDSEVLGGHLSCSSQVTATITKPAGRATATSVPVEGLDAPIDAWLAPEPMRDEGGRNTYTCIYRPSEYMTHHTERLGNYLDSRFPLLRPPRCVYPQASLRVRSRLLPVTWLIALYELLRTVLISVRILL
jgi:hypothetical protein